jgi:hypothetical protein
MSAQALRLAHRLQLSQAVPSECLKAKMPNRHHQHLQLHTRQYTAACSAAAQAMVSATCLGLLCQQPPALLTQALLCCPRHQQSLRGPSTSPSTSSRVGRGSRSGWSAWSLAYQAEGAAGAPTALAALLQEASMPARLPQTSLHQPLRCLACWSDCQQELSCRHVSVQARMK